MEVMKMIVANRNKITLPYTVSLFVVVVVILCVYVCECMHITYEVCKWY